jgi:hypothetical protein
MSILKHLFDRQPFENNKLRIIITRHGERADLALGSEWTALIPTNGNSNSPISHLTRRADIREWEYDPPLTTHGEHQAISTGRKLLKFRSPIDYCYSSPSYRSIQTANKILEGQGRKYIPINIEPGMINKLIIYLLLTKKDFFLKVCSNVLHGMMVHFHLYLLII